MSRRNIIGIAGSGKSTVAHLLVEKRVALSGASGTGKTTLANFIAEMYGLPVNPVGSRSVSRAMGFASPYDVDAAGRRAEFQNRLLTEKVAWEAAHDEFVTDRTTADNLAYLALHGVRAIDGAMIEAAQESLRRYSLIFFCPVSAFWGHDADPARIEDFAYQRVYDATLRGMLQSFAGDVNIVVLNLPDLAARKQLVEETLRGPGRSP